MVFFMALILAGLALLGLWYADRLMKPDDSEQPPQFRKQHRQPDPVHAAKR